MPIEVLTALLALLGVLIGFLVEVLKERISVRGDTKNHISKARFDKEFEIYQELSEKNLSMVYGVGDITVCSKMLLDTNFDEQTLKDIDFESKVTDLCTRCNDADFSNKKYAPFINKDIYENFKSLHKKCDEVFYFAKFITQNRTGTALYRHKENIYNKNESVEEIIKIQKEISTLTENILNALRNYLKLLDVKEK